ncbi:MULTISPECIES: NAD-dependent epimerase/dehydratase family protein [unclassified Pseudovibrio]|uniref:NAD-dependent epimerase/dehydratase family protein n=1 Tax=unclassified Pseudovibrio TaxID=2627060 RepID=UPI0007AEE536|nr:MULTISPECIES: NAD-dependent epimerase/dehydratase family protein [unclassified Pseudovibrio]KZK92600.1 CDP-paratose 2-epimerase [Pseudovibrio sp. W74]KZL10359.1 CDP-paratose 2-epimerase [Pseudovibrio sp. Ad14]
MKILLLGGDGFCGWPTALHLSNLGHNVIIIDNLSRRRIDIELNVGSLTPIRTINERVHAWFELTGHIIQFIEIDIAHEFDKLISLLRNEKPDSIVHFAEQRAAPYSMKNCDSKNYTITNNICGTHNILNAIVEVQQDIHLVHLGTMGVYGYGHDEPIPIPEGYLDVQINTSDNRQITDSIVYPPNPGSVYHMTKTMDAQMFQYYAKNDKLRITDLHQGIVWGTQTQHTSLDERLINRFDYDGDYGTVLNRFLMQAAVGLPLTIHGTGGQTRAFIHISDTCKCIEYALLAPPPLGSRPAILNQMSETCSLSELAKCIQSITGCEISYVQNPRNEAEKNDLVVKNDHLQSLGWQPTLMEDSLFREVTEITERYRERADHSKIRCVSYWSKKTKQPITTS